MKDKNHTAPPRLANWLLKILRLQIGWRNFRVICWKCIPLDQDGRIKSGQTKIYMVGAPPSQAFKGKKSADFQYHTRFNADMIRNSLKITRRGLVKNGKYALINLSGLTLD